MLEFFKVLLKKYFEPTTCVVVARKGTDSVIVTLVQGGSHFEVTVINRSSKQCIYKYRGFGGNAKKQYDKMCSRLH